jgi:hypothetical protein
MPTEAQLVEQLWIGNQLEFGCIEGQVIGEDRICLIIAEHDHQDALDEVQQAHEGVEAPQATKGLLSGAQPAAFLRCALSAGLWL